MIRVLTAAAVCLPLLHAQPTRDTGEHWRALSFLEGTWEARSHPAQPGTDASGTYTFRKDLGGHLLARITSPAAGCAGQSSAVCNHRDLLYVYQETPGRPLRAIYFDNEGHVIHYSVSTPSPGRAVFLSDPAAAGPRFRLVYELRGASMEGKFEMLMPGKTEWISYLAWSGTKHEEK